MSAIENLEQRVEERIEAVVINHRRRLTQTHRTHTNTHTHTDDIQPAKSDRVLVLGIFEGVSPLI